MAVLLLFTSAATKLPSYWLPATPAAAVLVTWAASTRGRFRNAAVGHDPVDHHPGCRILDLPHLDSTDPDPEIPTLAIDLMASGLVLRAAVWFSLAALLGITCGDGLVWFTRSDGIPVAVPSDGAHPDCRARRSARQPLSDRSLTRSCAATGRGTLAMMVMKPLHYHTNQVVLCRRAIGWSTGQSADRLANERRG